MRQCGYRDTRVSSWVAVALALVAAACEAPQGAAGLAPGRDTAASSVDASDRPGPGGPTTVSGRVIDLLEQRGLAFATVATSPPSAAVTTNAEGRFVIEANLMAGLTYRVTATKPGYVPGSVDVTVLAGSNQLADLALVRNPDGVECSPACRDGFECLGGTCVARCNPPCPLGEVCADGACLPECRSDCGGRECGPDPTCGTSCGTCAANERCSSDGRCTCDGAFCGAECCASGAVCANGGCCVPACAGVECGLDPVCGQPCGAGCDDDDPCTRDVCEGTICAHPVAPDGTRCGSGTCEAGECRCVATCGARECGSDGCGGTCGACPSGTVCESGACVVPCTDSCASLGWDCDVVCGEDCGSCAGRERCEDGVCRVPPLTVPFFEGFESGLGLWTSTSTWGSGSVIAPGWHITSLDHASGARSAWTGDEASDRTEVGTHALALAEAIDLAGTRSPRLRFQYQKLDNASRSETFYVLRVFVSRNGGLGWNEVYAQGALSEWMPVEVDLSDYAGESILLEFRYANSGWSTPGMFLDDVEVVDP